jgi:hypothetical protein
VASLRWLIGYIAATIASMVCAIKPKADHAFANKLLQFVFWAGCSPHGAAKRCGIFQTAFHVTGRRRSGSRRKKNAK